MRPPPLFPVSEIYVLLRKEEDQAQQPNKTAKCNVP